MKKETPQELRDALAEREARYKELKEKGVKALSKYDIEIAHMGDAQGALRTALMLVGNHIKWYKGKLGETKEQLQLL